ncbi:hypothetical protein DFH09DRAFT_1082782 [Mycena vulgaris]|nr:hypothetical protein DFH09DRAFT_1082782 [Mycena vulgaris]
MPIARTTAVRWWRGPLQERASARYSAPLARVVAQQDTGGHGQHYQKSKDIGTSRHPTLVPSNDRTPSAFKGSQEKLCSTPLCGARRASPVVTGKGVEEDSKREPRW